MKPKRILLMAIKANHITERTQNNDKYNIVLSSRIIFIIVCQKHMIVNGNNESVSDVFKRSLHRIILLN